MADDSVEIDQRAREALCHQQPRPGGLMLLWNGYPIKSSVPKDVTWLAGFTFACSGASVELCDRPCAEADSSASALGRPSRAPSSTSACAFHRNNVAGESLSRWLSQRPGSEIAASFPERHGFSSIETACEEVQEGTVVLVLPEMIRQTAPPSAKQKVRFARIAV